MEKKALIVANLVGFASFLVHDIHGKNRKK